MHNEVLALSLSLSSNKLQVKCMNLLPKSQTEIRSPARLRLVIVAGAS